MAWPGNRRRDVALGYDRRVGIYEPQEFRYIDRPPHEGVDLNEPPRRPQTTELVGCGPPQRYNMQASVPGCPEPPGRLMYISESHFVPAGGTIDYVFDSPGIFCPQRMIITGAGLIFISKISTGTRNQVITGDIPVDVFSMDNTCCPIACLDCMCAPGVQMVVTLKNIDVVQSFNTVSLVGVYYDIPAGMTAREASANVVKGYPGCPVPGKDKLVGFVTGAPGDDLPHTVTVNIETPGRFCPRQLFFTPIAGLTLDNTFVTSVRTAVDENIISGRIPIRFWSIANDCCVMTCLPCLCMPGVPMQITLDLPGSGSGSVLAGTIVGDYEDAC